MVLLFCWGRFLKGNFLPSLCASDLKVRREEWDGCNLEAVLANKQATRDLTE